MGYFLEIFCLSIQTMKKLFWKDWWKTPGCYRNFICKWLKRMVKKHVNVKNSSIYSRPTTLLLQVCYCTVQFWSVRNTAIFTVLLELNLVIFHSLLHLSLNLFLLWWKREVNYNQSSYAHMMRTLIANENLLSHFRAKLPHCKGAYNFLSKCKSFNCESQVKTQDAYL